ncbi:hypothetical protein Dsin_013580 [Dipteronia sinensis]|uniref:Uncharacterized protein n=1 Tax=Dipteronia sinensis TaxID=43782 RepID=A0AAE0EAQ2_9ROSI|nr:hypothetical protein Dsin_013580 [Dipteronia sinensis]
MGGVDVDPMNINRTSSSGGGEASKGTEARKDTRKVVKAASSKNVVKQGNRKVGGSRFEILSENVEGISGVVKTQYRNANQKNVESFNVLFDISIASITKSSYNLQWGSQPNKQLKAPFKENATGDETTSIGTVKKKGKQHVNKDTNHSNNKDEDLDNSEEQVLLPVDNCMGQVDITCASNFEEIALKLKEAMKGITE